MVGRPFLTTLIFSLALSEAALAQTAASMLPTVQPAWSQLNAQQRTALAPLSKEWNDFTDNRKQKWLGIAKRYAALSPLEQARMQDRMREWIGLSPAQRNLARAQYKKLRQAPQEQKIELSRKWQEYEALSSNEKQRLQTTPLALASPATLTPVKPPKTLLAAPPRSKSRALVAPVNTEQEEPNL